MANPTESSSSVPASDPKPVKPIWRVTVWLWRQEETDAEGGVGTEIETFELPDRDLAVAAAHMLIDRYACLASSLVEVDVSLSGPIMPGEGGAGLSPSFKYGRDTETAGSSCLSH